jgi:uncharacterized Zn-binding protein involved in type VI secretion
MPAAARLGDLTTHGSIPLTPMSPPPAMCSKDVLIGGQPAWRAISDTHVCPLANGPQPHVGGVVAKGSTSVFIDGLPAVRQGDVIQEAGGPNAITGGCLTVQIGG